MILKPDRNYKQIKPCQALIAKDHLWVKIQMDQLIYILVLKHQKEKRTTGFKRYPVKAGLFYFDFMAR
jgi:hypothetical protein